MESNNGIKEKLLTLGIGTLAIIVVLGSMSLINFYLSKKNQTIEQPQKEDLKINPSEFPDYDAIKGEKPDTKINSISMCSLDKECVNDKPATINFDGPQENYIVKGKFSRAYLFIDALVDYNRPLTSWDDFYFTMNTMGGHLIPDENLLPVPAGDTSRYLYNLKSISYFPRIQDKEKNVNKKVNMDLFWMLQNENNLNLHASISSNRPGRVIKEVSIFFECFEGSDCAITEINQ